MSDTQQDRITLVSAYYNQPEALAERWNVLRKYGDLSEKVSLRFCDDCSPDYPLEIPKDIQEAFDVQAFRLKGKEPWKEMVARNLCMKHVDGWALLLDMDFMCDRDSARLFLDMNKVQGNKYVPSQRDVETKQRLVNSTNMYLMHEHDFWLLGGYDEQFAGAYGFSDCVFRLCVVKSIPEVVLGEILIDHYPLGGAISDASTPPERKDVARNQPIHRSLIAQITKFGVSSYLSRRKSFEFEWERIV